MGIHEWLRRIEGMSFSLEHFSHHDS